MGLHLVGETIGKDRSHYQAEAGKLVQLMRGIYVDQGDDIDAIVLKHAVRIAKYLYPKAYLSAASAILLGPMRDGRLFLSSRRNQRTRIRALEIIQNQAPNRPSIETAIIDDGIGEFQVPISSFRQRFLEAFRVRSEHAASIDDGMREAIANRLTAGYGSPKAAADAVWALARENDWLKEGVLAERYLLNRTSAPLVKNQAALETIVAWHGVPIGQLNHDGFEWRWIPGDAEGPPLVRQTTPGQLPPFIISLLPEGWLEEVLKSKDERTLLRSGKRYMSNIAIVERRGELATVPPDILLSGLANHSKDGVFTGRYDGPARGDIEESFERSLARIYESADTPRLSGIQIKAPMHLDSEGRLTPATGRPFTHILKPAGTGVYEILPAVEWTALALGEAVGLDVPARALVQMPNGTPPSLLVERFDIRRGFEDKRMLALEDMCSVLDLPTEAKYDGTLERVARAVRSLSTAPEQDLITLLNRALFAWLIADGDMHLKNMALLKATEPGNRTFRTVRMAPLYDSVTTRVFPRLKHDRMAIKVNGKDDRLRRSDFRAWATTVGLRASDVDVAIDGMTGRLEKAIDQIELPKRLVHGPDSKKIILEMVDIIRSRIGALE